MIRFCDKEVICLELDEISRNGLIDYFLNGHLDEPICILDNFGRYLGYITYHSLIRNKDTNKAIETECLILNRDIWKTARLFFAFYRGRFEEYPLLPVVDTNQKLLCFAYEDHDADRELRMIWELQEDPDALQFKDLYPECQCVKIYGFNELAYFFAKYLEIQGIPTQVEGSMWKDFFSSDQEEFIDHSYMNIYAEGVLAKPVDWMQNLLRSVSVEFECIDQIYEKNIKTGRIKNADKDSRWLMAYLKEMNEVVILGTDTEALDAYDYLISRGIRVCGFAEDCCGSVGNLLFGKPILKIVDAMEQFEHVVFVDNHDQGSAWGMGKTDYFSYLGYKRNRDFFLLKDYLQICECGLKNALKDQAVVLTGDFLLCDKLAGFFERNEISGKGKVKYVSFLEDTFVRKSCRLEKVKIEEVEPDELCLIVMPDILSLAQMKKSKERKEQIISYLKETGIKNYTDYFSHMKQFINIEKEIEDKYQIEFLKPKRIVIGSINACSGNIFFKGLLDYHPAIVMMDYGYLNNDLFWFCMRLSGKNSDEIPSLFLKLYDLEWEGEELEDINLFIEKMCQLLECEKDYTSQELFVIFHIAYMFMYGININSPKDIMIYWEPHFVTRSVLEECVQWLGEEVKCDIVNIVRNICMRNGSNIKGILDQNWTGRGSICHIAIATDDSEKKKYSNSNRLIVRFEDLKCRPKEELRKICRSWEIPWSDTLMHVSVHGKERLYDNGNKAIKDFDLTPVYHTYEEYFSEFDRFKISLICMPYQKRYGYPYVDPSEFSRREIQEMFLKEFRFMNRLHFDTERTRQIFNIGFQNHVKKRIQTLKMITAAE